MVARAPRLVGEARQAVAEELAGRYHDGVSIRSLARESGRSYGLVQKLLREVGVEFRRRGGADPASPETKAERETVEKSQEVDQQDSVDSNTNGGGTSPSPEDIDALKLAVEAAVARAEKADRKAHKAEKPCANCVAPGQESLVARRPRRPSTSVGLRPKRLIARYARRVVG